MADIVRAQREQIPATMKTRYRDMGDGTHARVVAADGDTTIAWIDVPTGAPILGQVAIAVTGTAVQLSAASVPLPSGMVIVAAHPDNTAAITVGAAAVTNTVNGTGNGAILAPGEAIAVFAANVNLIYINGTANDIASYSAA